MRIHKQPADEHDHRASQLTVQKKTKRCHEFLFVMKFKIQMTQDETDHGPFRCNREGGVPTLLKVRTSNL